MQVSSVTVVAGARFNPRNKEATSKAHLLQVRRGSSSSMPETSAHLACWDPSIEIQDSFLAGVVQMLSLELEVEMDCVLAAGYRLPQEICLNLSSQPADPSNECVKALYNSLHHCNASKALQVLVFRMCSGFRAFPHLLTSSEHPACNHRWHLSTIHRVLRFTSQWSVSRFWAAGSCCQISRARGSRSFCRRAHSQSENLRQFSRTVRKGFTNEVCAQF